STSTTTRRSSTPTPGATRVTSRPSTTTPRTPTTTTLRPRREACDGARASPGRGADTGRPEAAVKPIVRDAARGALAGAAATWLMDLVTTRLHEAQPATVTAREEAAQPNAKSSVANMVDRFETTTGLSIPASR